MHLIHQLLPNPLGDAQDVLKRQVFGPRVAASAGAAGITSLPTEFVVTAGVAVWHSQNANTVFAGPDGSGPATGTPAFRALVDKDGPPSVLAILARRYF